MYTPPQMALFILVCSLGTMLTRFLPFFVFKEGKPIPKYITYLGNVLPYAITGFLVVYCLKDVSLTTGNHGVPEILSILLIILVHILKRNTLLSIMIGTICYMLLINIL